MRQARSLDTYLDSADVLARLSAHADRLIKLQRVFQEIAPDFLAESSRVANFKLGKVIIHADSGAVAARLAQMLPTLIDGFSTRGAEVTQIQVKVQPTYAAPQHGKSAAHKARIRPVAEKVKVGLSELAGALPGESTLKAALERLVKRSR